MTAIENVGFDDPHPAQRPECQPVVDAMWAWMKREKMPPMKACELVYGRYPDGPNKGKVRGTGMFYPMLRGTLRPTQANSIAFQVAGLDLTAALRAMEAYMEQHGPTILPPHAKQSTKKIPNSPPATPAQATPARAAVAAYQEAAPHIIEPRKRAPPAFALTIDQDGRASLQLNLVDIDAADALRCVEALRAVGVLKT